MLRRWQVNHFNKYAVIGLIILVLASTIFSCTVPRKYQKDKPFIYKTSIELETQGLQGVQKQDLKARLENQIDDSLKVRTVLAIRAKPPFFFNRLVSPPVFDTIYLRQSRTFMKALLNSQGYFRPTITDTFRIDTVKNQQRVSVLFKVSTGTLLRYDSIGYDLSDTALQRLAVLNRSKSKIHVNEGYSLQN